MPTRRQFLLYGVGTMLLTCTPVFAQSTNKQIPISAQGIADAFGDGLKFTGIVLEYSQPVNAEQINIRQFNVQDRKILSYFISNQPNGTAQAQGKFVVLTLDPNEDNASLVQKKTTAYSQ